MCPDRRRRGEDGAAASAHRATSSTRTDVPCRCRHAAPSPAARCDRANNSREHRARTRHARRRRSRLSAANCMTPTLSSHGRTHERALQRRVRSERRIEKEPVHRRQNAGKRIERLEPHRHKAKRAIDAAYIARAIERFAQACERLQRGIARRIERAPGIAQIARAHPRGSTAPRSNPRPASRPAP